MPVSILKQTVNRFDPSIMADKRTACPNPKKRWKMRDFMSNPELFACHMFELLSSTV